MACAKRTLRRVLSSWREDVRVWHPGQQWLWEPGGLGVFDPGIKTLSIATRILPKRLLLRDAAAAFRRTARRRSRRNSRCDADATPMTASFDFLQLGHETWYITCVPSWLIPCWPFAPRQGGSRLTLNGCEAPLAPLNAEYPAVYAHFAASSPPVARMSTRLRQPWRMRSCAARASRARRSSTPRRQWPLPCGAPARHRIERCGHAPTQPQLSEYMLFSNWAEPGHRAPGSAQKKNNGERMKLLHALPLWQSVSAPPAPRPGHACAIRHHTRRHRRGGHHTTASHGISARVITGTWSDVAGAALARQHGAISAMWCSATTTWPATWRGSRSSSAPTAGDANRIAGAKFTLDGKAYSLATNNGPNALHGARKASTKSCGRSPTRRSAPSRACYADVHEPLDGEEGYPGTLKASITYMLDYNQTLTTRYEATTDKLTHRQFDATTACLISPAFLPRACAASST